jgi:hypothetical protein
MKTLKSLIETFRTVAKHEQGTRKQGVTEPEKKYVGNTPVSLKGKVPAPTLGTQEFIDDHEIEMVPDANGNGDEVFKGSKVKPIDRKKEKHGYDAKASAEVNEMSDAQMKKREDIVKGMKKNLSSFTQRYGKDAKSVMYATATKRAMGEEVSVEYVQEETKYDCILEAVEAHKQSSHDEQELVNAYAAILESIYESLETEEEKEKFNTMLESEDAFDELVTLVESVVAEGDE